MSVMKLHVALLCIATVVSAPVSRASSQASRQPAPAKTAIFLDCPAQDVVGRSLCFRVREEFRKSSGFELAADVEKAFVRARIHTVDKDSPATGTASAVAVILTLAKGEGFLHDQVLYVGRNAVDAAAVGIVAGIDSYLDQLFKDAAKGRGRGGV
jgi:hypothetical protein